LDHLPCLLVLDLLRADKDSELEGRLTANEEEQAGVDDAGEDDKGRSGANCRQEEDEEVGKDQPSTKRRKPLRSARGGSSRRYLTVIADYASHHEGILCLVITRAERAKGPWRSTFGR
jgi:hypothetical protein